jgi:hypothetical protein
MKVLFLTILHFLVSTHADFFLPAPFVSALPPPTFVRLSVFISHSMHWIISENPASWSGYFADNLNLYLSTFLGPRLLPVSSNTVYSTT